LKIRIQVFLTIFLTIGCTHNSQTVERNYSCFDKNSNVEIFYERKDVFYTWLEYGIGTVAFKRSNGEVYRLHPEFGSARLCSLVKDEGGL